LLRQAVELSAERSAARKRAKFWRWQREFFSDKGITDQSAIREAVEELQDMIAEEKANTRRKGIRVGTQFAFLAGSVTLGLLSAPLAAAAVGAAFISVGQFVADRLLEGKPQTTDSPVALLWDARKHFGWN